MPDIGESILAEIREDSSRHLIVVLPLQAFNNLVSIMVMFDKVEN